MKIVLFSIVAARGLWEEKEKFGQKRRKVLLLENKTYVCTAHKLRT